jgi:hypothetical protein
MNDEERAFRRFQPQLDERTSVEAAQSFGLGNEIVSLNTKQAGLDSLILLLATDSEIQGPFLLNQICARELCAQLIGAGFGPSQTPPR